MIAKVVGAKEPTFEERYDECIMYIEKRRHKWTLHSVAFDDVRQRIIIRIWRQYKLFIPTKKDRDGKPVEFRKWVNKVISNEWKNVLRDNHFKWSRPCIQGRGGCPFNAGGDACTAPNVKSGKQCDECPLYRDWRIRKESHFALNQTLPLDNHAQEVHSIQGDTVDIAAAKQVIDRHMKERLTPHEYRIYRYLFVLGKTPEETGKLMGYRKRKGGRMFAGYQVLLSTKHKIVAMAKEIIDAEGLA